MRSARGRRLRGNGSTVQLAATANDRDIGDVGPTARRSGSRGQRARSVAVPEGRLSEWAAAVRVRARVLDLSPSVRWRGQASELVVSSEVSSASSCSMLGRSLVSSSGSEVVMAVVHSAIPMGEL